MLPTTANYDVPPDDWQPPVQALRVERVMDQRLTDAAVLDAFDAGRSWGRLQGYCAGVLLTLAACGLTTLLTMIGG